MTVGIVGLGLIGGSMAYAYSEANHTVYAEDINENTLSYAMLRQAVTAPLTEENIGDCEVLLLCLYPADTIVYLRTHAQKISKDTLVIDTCGIKGSVCEAGFALAKEYGFSFVGGHPMAGLQYSGFKHARGNLFRDASMVLVPPNREDIAVLHRCKTALSPLGFGRFTVMESAEHDEMIAYTSQLAHLVSNAYVKSPLALGHRGCSAGSLRDLTRVAKLNEVMWTQLFLENRQSLLAELDTLLSHLSAYRDALEAGDALGLQELLKEGRIRKEQMDHKN